MANGTTTAVVAKRVPDSPTLQRTLKIAIATLAVASLILHYGFEFGSRFARLFNWLDVFLACGLAAILLGQLVTARRWHEAIHERYFEVLLLGGSVAALLLLAILSVRPFAEVFPDRVAGRLFGVVKLFLLGNICLQLLRILQRIFVAGVRPEIVLAGSFAALILVGMLLLLLPTVGAKQASPITPMDALFTSTSAVCVTGLVVRDTGSEFSTLGQMIILALFQVGGLGIVTFVAFISVFSAKTLPVPQMVAFRQMISASERDDLKIRIAGILLLTALIEASGALSLYIFATAGDDPLERLKWSVFHAVSAFCNAGFALQANSLEAGFNNPALNITISLLIVLGGLGFLVLPELIALAGAGLRLVPHLLHAKTRRFTPHLPRRMSVQTRISLIVTFGLIVAGLVGFWWIEAGHILRGRSAGDAFLVSLFQSVTTRTAGFNTVPIGEVQQATLLLLIMLMVIGGSPVSTAGGIKTVTLGILFFALRSLIFQRERVEAFGRTLPARAFFTALNVAVLYITTAGGGMFLLSLFDPHLALRDISFETISALSTVGLSTGTTAGLSSGSKLVLCAAMFIGRVGPIALVFSVFQSRGKVEYEFPAEDVVVG